MNKSEQKSATGGLLELRKGAVSRLKRKIELTNINPRKTLWCVILATTTCEKTS